MLMLQALGREPRARREGWAGVHVGSFQCICVNGVKEKGGGTGVQETNTADEQEACELGETCVESSP